MSSGIVLAGTDGCTTMTSGTTIMPVTGAMSMLKRMRLNTEANRTLRCAFGLGNLVQSQTSAVFVLNHQLNNKTRRRSGALRVLCANKSTCMASGAHFGKIVIRDA